VTDEKIDALLGKVDRDKRTTLKRLILGTSFVIPVIASFPIDGLTIDRALAQGANGSITTIVHS
jgi:hypothetical protein